MVTPTGLEDVKNDVSNVHGSPTAIDSLNRVKSCPSIPRYLGDVQSVE